MYKQVDTDVYVDIAPENIIFTDNIDLDRFFNLYSKMDSSFPVAIPSFSGLSCDNFNDFLNKFDNICVFKNVNDDDRKRALFNLCITGPARIYYDSLAAGQKDSWDNVLEAFQGKYAAPLSTAQLQAENMAFHHIVWQQGQDLEVYAAMIQSKGKVLNKSDGEIAAQFCSGLPARLAFFVRAQNPATFEQAVELAHQGKGFGYAEETTTEAPIRDLTAAVQTLRRAQPHFPSPQQYPTHTSQYPVQQRPDHQQPYPVQQQHPNHQQQYPFQAEVHPIHAEPYPVHQEQHIGHPQPHHPYGQRSSAVRPSPSPRRPTANNNCQRCDCPGHIATACNLMDNTRPRRNFVCARCNQFGHGTARCILAKN